MWRETCISGSFGFQTEGIKRKFAEKKTSESWIAAAGYFNICKNTTGQKGTDGRRCAIMLLIVTQVDRATHSWQGKTRRGAHPTGIPSCPPVHSVNASHTGPIGFCLRSFSCVFWLCLVSDHPPLSPLYTLPGKQGTDGGALSRKQGCSRCDATCG